MIHRFCPPHALWRRLCGTWTRTFSERCVAILGLLGVLRVVSTKMLPRSVAHRHIRRAGARQKSAADRRHSDAPVYTVGDRVWLSTRNLPLRLPCRKLGPRFVGPFKVLRRVNEVTYKLQLPPDYRINASLHVSLLRRWVVGPLQRSEV